MSVLTISFTQQIEEALRNNHFLPEDFTITTKDYTGYVRLTIVYNYMPEFTFYSNIFKEEEKFTADFIPGRITKLAKKKDLDSYHFFESIQEWLENAYKEMNKIPIARKVREQEDLLKSFQEKIQSMDEAGERHFTKEEGQELCERLEKLEEYLRESINERTDNENKQIKEISALHSEIDTLKTQLEVLSRKNWFLSLSTRMYNWYKTNPLLARQLAGFTREMLPQEAKDVVSQEALDQLLLPPDSGSGSSANQ
ncbi:hypothetical protein V7152_18920 [Neobacillus drentensis]|uniref:hypothetical protein n=1 Tax=Neobacillus drentensis TaxID=220684 RepID=UPI002FFED6E0